MEKLIQIVRDNPILYDTSHEYYMRTKLKDDLWEKIGREMNYTDGKAAKEQWRKIRECHREALRRQQKKSGQEGIITRPWTYQKHMEFLKPFMKNRGTVVYPSTPSLEREGEEDELRQFDQPNVEICQPDEEADQPAENPTSKKMKKSLVTDPALQWFIEDSEMRAKMRDELRQNLVVQGQQQAQLQNDALYLFFMSMYNITKDLPSRYQRQIRRKVFEVVSQAEDDAESESLSLQSNSQLSSSSS